MKQFLIMLHLGEPAAPYCERHEIVWTARSIALLSAKDEDDAWKRIENGGFWYPGAKHIPGYLRHLGFYWEAYMTLHEVVELPEVTSLRELRGLLGPKKKPRKKKNK